MKRLISLVTAVLCGISCCAAEPSTGAAKPGEWRSLFDGQSLAGWRSTKSAAAPEGWRVVDQALVRVSGGGDLVTSAEFGDFEFEFEWKVSEGANSGVIYRASLTEPELWHTGPEYQLLDNQKAADRFIESHRAGSVFDIAAPRRDATRPVGEWNSGRIMVKGWRVQHWLNGEKVVEIDLAGAEGRRLIAGSKFKDRPKYATLSRGHIALQDHGQVVSFRNLRIRELK